MIYLDNAATSFPKPSGVIAEYDRCMRFYAANTGRSAHKMSIMAAEKTVETRELIASLFNINNSERIAFTQNATMALNMGVKGVLKAGDHVIISSMEHNSVLRPVVSLKKIGVEVSIAKAGLDGVVTPDEIIKNITPNTKLICIMHASNVTGSINDIKSIGDEARKRGIIFMVDAAQSAGILSIDVERDNIDILAFPGHKGLLGPQGTGGIYVREGVELETIIEGGTGSSSALSSQPLIFPDRLESGTINLPGIAGLSGGVNYILSRGIDTIREHELKLTRILTERFLENKKINILGSKNPENKVGIVCVTFEGISPSKMAYLLDKDFDIATRSGLHCSFLAADTLGILDEGSLRFSVGYFNTPLDIDMAVKAVNQIIN